MKALIVDDHAAMRRLLGSCLPDAWEFAECGDGAAAVTAYPGLRPDCVLMDVEMPVMDGFTAAARLRELDPAAWIVFVSQHAGAGFREMAARLGARAFVPKQHLDQLAATLPPEPGAAGASPVLQTTDPTKP
jgi:CheY-like chemotaxis protein